MTVANGNLKRHQLQVAFMVVAVLGGICIVFAPNVGAVTVTFQEGVAGYIGTVDTFIQEKTSDQDNDNGTAQTITLQEKTSDNWDILMRFDLSPIPAGQVVSTATFTLNKEAGDTNTLTVTAYKLTAGSWSEGDGNSATAGHADWNHRIHATTTWTSGDFSTSDYDLASGMSTSVSVNGLYSWNLTAMTQAWYANSATNFGFVLIGSGVNNKQQVFSSSEKSTSSLRPKLTVTYAAAPPVIPEPASVLLFGLGGLGMNWTRRRKRNALGRITDPRDAEGAR